MRRIPRALTITVLTLVAMVCVAVSGPGVTLAHAGHESAQGVSMLEGLFQIAATIAVLVIAYILASWYFRYVGPRTHRESGDEIDSPQRRDSDGIG